MGRNFLCSFSYLLAILFFVYTTSAFASATFISDGVLQAQSSSAGSRSLLQAKNKCPIDFAHKNYTILTSRCKLPDFPAKLCCQAFKDFACPYAKQLNDLSNGCADLMFSYINLYFPPGLFTSKCVEGKKGLACPPHLT